MNLEQARFNMIEQQVRPWEVLDQRVLDVMASVPREKFVPEGYAQLAFSDTEIPIGHDEFMLPPKLQARLIQALELTGDEQVLEVGTGTGYGTALLSRLCESVVSLDIQQDFVSKAGDLLSKLNFNNVEVKCADALAASHDKQYFDAILVGGACAELPENLAACLKPGGRLVIVCGTGSIQEACLHKCVSEGQFSTESLFETRLPYLSGGAPAPKFDF